MAETLTLDDVWWKEQPDGSFILCFKTTTKGCDFHTYGYVVRAIQSDAWLISYGVDSFPGTHTFCDGDSMSRYWIPGTTYHVKLYRWRLQPPYTSGYIADISFIVPDLPIIECKQNFKVLDPAGNPIIEAFVSVPVPDLPESKVCTTDAEGNCFMMLEPDQVLLATAGHADYSPSDPQLFTSCSVIPPLVLKSKLVTQQFLVCKHDSYDPIENATVTVGTKTCSTNSDGLCSIDLPAGIEYTAIASAEGYECINDECKIENVLPNPEATMLLHLSGTCKQNFKVLDPAGNPVEEAFVSVPVPELPASKVCTTDADGNCSIEFLLNQLLFATASHADFLPSDTQSFTSCSIIPPLVLKPKIVTQEFLVCKHESYDPIENATVTIDSKTCTTNSEGLCSIDLPAGIKYSAIASAEGYECISDECKVENVLPNPEASMLLHLSVLPPTPPSAIVFSILEENIDAVAIAFSFARYAGCETAGFIRPPYICIVCGARLNSDEAFISHMTSHLFAYDAQGGT